MIFAFYHFEVKAKPNRKIGAENRGSTDGVDSRVAFGLKHGGNDESSASRFRRLRVL
jgi:hypothetical protein